MKIRKKVFNDEIHSCGCGNFSCNKKYTMGLVEFYYVCNSKYVVIAKHCKIGSPSTLEFGWKGKGYVVYRPRKNNTEKADENGFVFKSGLLKLNKKGVKILDSK